MRVSVADYAVTRAGNEAVVEEAVAEAAGDIADTPRDVLGKAFGEISELDLVGAICRMLDTLNTMLTVGSTLA